jgi:4-hydroxy-tetrahydrodipicolinate synthase
MANHHSLDGVYAAVVTPLCSDFSLALSDLLPLLDFLARRGCHGALLFGTTGEGPSFAVAERIAFFLAAQSVRQIHPDFKLLAGVGTPSLDETIDLTRNAFDLGMDGVVSLPPYYYRTASDDGLFAWYSQVIKRAVPSNGAFFGYHIPDTSGVSLSLDLLARLKDTFPDCFAGIKDSSANSNFACQLGQRFGDSLVIFNGSDRLFSLALSQHASGCITALANLQSPDLREVWDHHQKGTAAQQAQARLDASRTFMDQYAPAPPLLKSMLAQRYKFPFWTVRPPLMPMPANIEQQVIEEMGQLLNHLP